MYRGWEWFIKEEANAKGGMKVTMCKSIEVENNGTSSHSSSKSLNLKAADNMPLVAPNEADNREVRMEKNCKKSN